MYMVCPGCWVCVKCCVVMWNCIYIHGSDSTSRCVCYGVAMFV